MIITFAHQKGGVGKSTLAFNTAVELSKEYKVVVINWNAPKNIDKR